jgi:GTPase
MRSGFAALIGRPNVGKSTLLNRLLGVKVAIVSPKPQTTRTRILGVVHRDEGQLALFDTPGVHLAQGPMNKFMVESALAAIESSDVVLFLYDADGLSEERPPVVSPGNRYVLERLASAGKPVVCVITKVDLVKKPLLLPLIELLGRDFKFAEVVPISARQGEGLENLLSVAFRYLPDQPPLFPSEMLTDQTERTLVGELVREQVLRRCRQEIPYSTAVVVEHFDERERHTPPPGEGERAKAGAKGKAKGKKEPAGKGRTKGKKGEDGPGLLINTGEAPASSGELSTREGRDRKLSGLVKIHANVYVERDSQKAIIIGKRGAMLKQIGTDARTAVERMLGAHVFLSLQVKVEPRWSERADGLRKLGYGPEQKP